MKKYKSIAKAVLLSCTLALTTSCNDFLDKAPDILETEKIQIPSFYLLILIAMPLFLIFDRWMRKRYFNKHHP